MQISPEVRLSHVSKRYGAVAGLSDVSLTIAPGSFTVLLGPSGSGKSTLVRCLAGIERITDGSIAIGGSVVADRRAHIAPDKRELAMVFQDYALWPHMKVTGNVAFALRRRHLDASEARRRVGSMLERVGLAALAERYPAELSGGEQQRVALARALVARPGLLLFDEPLSNLDADLRDRLRVEIATLVREAGSTVVYITHDQSEAFALADQVGVLEAGRLVQLGPPEEIYARPATPFVARFTGLAGELPARILAARGDDEVHVEVGESTLTVGRQALGGKVSPGASTVVLVRPAATRFANASGESGCLSAVVLDTAFRGRGYEHVVEVPGGHRLGGVFDTRRRDPGSRVHVRLDPAGCHAFPTPEPGQAEPDPPGDHKAAAPAAALAEMGT